MRTITTSKNKTYEVDYCWAPCLNGGCGIGLRDARPLAEIIPEFDGLSHIHLIDTATGEFDFDGYTFLQSIRRTGEQVHIELRKEARSDGENH